MQLLIKKFPLIILKINQFKNKNLAQQHAVGVSFDFDKMVNLINEKTRLSYFRSELGVCHILNDNQPLATTTLQSTSSSKINNLNKKKQNSADANTSNLMIHSNNNQIMQLEIRNRLMLYNQFYLFNKNLNISTHMIHEKFSVI